VHLDGLVELRRLHLLQEPDRLDGGVLVLPVEGGTCAAVLLAVIAHASTSVSTPIDWAVPAMIRIA
jgi:hypothetical protein